MPSSDVKVVMNVSEGLFSGFCFGFVAFPVAPQFGEAATQQNQFQPLQSAREGCHFQVPALWLRWASHLPLAA